MKTIILALLTLILTSAFTVAQSQENNCDKKAESYLANIGNLDSESYEIVEIQAGDSALNKMNELEYNNSNYRLSGYTQSVSVKLVLEAKTCLLKTATVNRK
jgi:hypothetical protein